MFNRVIVVFCLVFLYCADLCSAFLLNLLQLPLLYIYVYYRKLRWNLCIWGALFLSGFIFLKCKNKQTNKQYIMQLFNLLGKYHKAIYIKRWNLCKPNSWYKCNVIKEKLNWMSITTQDFLHYHIIQVLFIYLSLSVFLSSDSWFKQVLILQVLCPLVKHGHFCVICALPSVNNTTLLVCFQRRCGSQWAREFTARHIISTPHL